MCLALALIFDCDLYVLHSHDVTRLNVTLPLFSFFQ